MIINRWKIASLLFASTTAIAGVVAYKRGPSPRNVPAATVSSGRKTDLSDALRRPMRVSAAALGLSEQDLIDRARSARSTSELSLVMAKLHTVGTDESVSGLADFLKDPRRGVPEEYVGLLGRVATDLAVDQLLTCAKDERPNLRRAAINALGESRSEKGEPVLFALAEKTGDPMQDTAVMALGSLASTKSTALLIKIATTAPFETASQAVYALGATHSDESRAALMKLTEAADPRIAMSALQSIDEVDDELAKKLGKIVEDGNWQLANSAMSALAKANVEIALPILKKAAMVGASNMRYSAIWAIGELAGDKPIEVLAELLRTGDRNTAPPAAQALANAGGPLAREALIEVALSDRGEWSGALAQLQMMQGDDVDQALLEVVKNGTSQERRLALPRLLKAGNKLAIALAIDMASSGSRNERTDAMRMLADSGQPAAIDALIAIADASRGQTRMTALEMLIQNRPADSALTKMLTDSLSSGRMEEAGYAAQLLGRMGTPNAKAALIAAVTGRDPMLALAAINALGQNGVGEREKAALLTVARSGDAKVRALAAQQLLQAGASEGVQLAADLINGSDKSMAQQAVWSLANVQSPEAIRVLEQAINSRDPQIRSAAVSALGQHGDVAMTDRLAALARDSDPQVRSAALQSLGQIGGDKANQTLIDATRNGKSEDRVTAVQSLASKDDDRTSRVLADLIRDRDPQVAMAAIGSAYNGGDEVDQSLIALMNAAGTSQDLRTSAANQLRSRGTDLDEKTEQAVKDIAGPPQMYGGYGYGGYVGEPSYD